MLKITLYSNCCLNDKYQVVFSLFKPQGAVNNYLENYLETLLEKEITLDNVYYENSGVINFDYELLTNIDIYQFNYAKFKLFDDNNILVLTRYCFVSKIEIKNDIVYLYYKEDIFSSYADKIRQCMPSYMSRKRINPASPFNLPVEYNSNNALNYEAIETLNDVFYIIVQMQEYSVSNQGNPTSRRNCYCLLGKGFSNRTTDRTFSLSDCEFSYADIFGYNGRGDIASLLKLKQTECFNEYFNTERKGYFELGNIYILPKNIFNLSNLTLTSTVAFGYINWSKTVISDVNHYSCSFVAYNFQSKNVFTEVYSKSITNNFKTLKIGTFMQNFDIVNNGTDVKIKVYITINESAFSIYLSVGDNIIDISDSFLYVLSFDYLNGETLSQYKLSREMKTINGIAKIGVGTIETGLDTASALGTGGISLFGSEGRNITTKIRSKTKSGNMKWRTVSKREPGTESALDLMSDGMSGIEKTINGITNLIEVNAPIYSSSKGVFVNRDDFYTSILFGLVKFKISPDNEDFVKKYTNETGYIVYQFINTTSFNNMLYNSAFVPTAFSATYDIIKFEYINLIGDFPNDIANQLNQIFENGVKIIYTNTPDTTDTYWLG